MIRTASVLRHVALVAMLVAGPALLGTEASASSTARPLSPSISLPYAGDGESLAVLAQWGPRQCCRRTDPRVPPSCGPC